MPVTATLSDHFKYQRDMGLVDLATDSIKVLLMRTLFTFAAGKHLKLINVKTNSGSIASLTFANSGSTLTRGAGSFVTDGFVVGMEITTNSANANNQGPFLVSVLAAGVLTVTDMVGATPTLTTGTESSVTVTGDDEIATGGGYIQDTKTLTSQAVTEDDSAHVSTMLCADVSWLGSGAGFGPTAGAILYDDTTSDNTIIGYLNFGGDQTIAAAASLVLSGLGIQAA
jgi:hypothetical protein